MVKCVVAVDEAWGIGKNNKLLFNIKADMENFISYTSNKVVVMGKNTLLSLPGGKPLKNRTNIVLCSKGNDFDGCICVHSLEELTNMVKCLSETIDVVIIGGGMLYKAMLPYCDEILVTKVHKKDTEATVFFPNLDKEKDFKVDFMSGPLLDSSGLTYRFVRYKKSNLS